MRAAVDDWAGSPVTAAISQPTGFSPGVAARLRLADGRRFFAKAAGPLPHPDAAAIHRREARIVAALPDGLAVPRLRRLFDQGAGGWVLLVFDDVDGRAPAQPWRLDELDRVLDGLADLAAGLTPSPIAPPAAISAADELGAHLCGWQRLQAADSASLDRLDAWSLDYLPALAELEANAPAAADGQTLLHFDVRADNVLLTEDRVWFVDWPHACVGAAWLDVVFFAPSVTMQGGPAPEDVITRAIDCRAADPHAITAAIAALAGYFTRQSLQPPPPGIPTVRAFQAAQGRVARQWLARRTGWT